MTPNAPKVMLCAGSSWYLWNFRRNLVRHFAASGWQICAVAPEDEWTERLSALERTSYVRWPVSLDGAMPLEEAASLRSLAGILRREEPDFVLNHGIKANVYGGLCCRGRSIPYANVVSGLGMRMSRQGIVASGLARLYSFACSGGVALIVQNTADLEFLRRNGLSPRLPIHQVMGSGVDLAYFRPEGRLDPRGQSFLFVGRLQRDKGIHDFVAAAALVRKESPSVRFVVVGDTRHANSGAVSDVELDCWRREGIVEFVGQCEDVRPWLARATTLVVPSHGGEGMPKVILEASASGRPVIATDVPGCRDAVVPGLNGWLCPPGDPEALAKAMRDVLRMAAAQLEEMGVAARKRAEEAFSDDLPARVCLELAEASIGRSSSAT
ncbi:MAG: glycosyltransferase family 4 protein [Rhodobacteraceae bacterium]|nr:glycosyltransferase family 4 protein [Paracoccaceae bacterium]